jgi:glycosyltransferase involved in cell wall biosynthesis
MQQHSLKILLLYDCIYPESLGGVEHRNYHLAKALADRRHQVTVAGWCQNAYQPFPGVQVLPMAFRTKLYNQAGQRSALTSLKFAAATLSLNLNQFDIIETANIPYIHLIPLAVRCAIARKPLVVSWYEYWGHYWREYKGVLTAPLYRGVEWLCAQIGKEVNASSSLTAERLQNHRLNSSKVRIIPCGVWLEQIQAATQKPKLNSPPLLYAGRLMKEKRIDLLLEAVQKIRLQQEEFTLSIVGDGPDRHRLEALTEQLGISKRVVFLGRLPTIDDVWYQLACAKIAIQPSSREGFGLFPLEAMALGIPVIYCESTENAISSLVRDGVEGICTSPNADALASAIEKLLNDRELWTRLSENSKKRAENYDWSKIAQQIEVFFDYALNKNG